MLVRLNILPAGAEQKPELLLADMEMPFDLPQDDARAKKLCREILFNKHEWRGTFPSDLQLGFYGSDFQWKVMQNMLKIPYGKTASYGALATKAGSPRAFRAAGSVCAANPLPLVVPCHRVVTATGALGNYGPGPAMKRQLLRWEGAALKSA